MIGDRRIEHHMVDGNRLEFDVNIKACKVMTPLFILASTIRPVDDKIIGSRDKRELGVALTAIHWQLLSADSDSILPSQS